MKRLVVALSTMLGFAPSAKAEPMMIDPNDILFSMPTISNELPPLDPVTRPPVAGEFALHEDEWVQRELLPSAMLPEIRQVLSEYKVFEAENRSGLGWKNAYVRVLNRIPVIGGKTALSHLETVLGANSEDAPLVTSGQGTTRVQSGFTFEIGRDVRIYGYTDETGITAMGVDFGENPDKPRFLEAFAKLNASDGLVFVDWRQQMILVSSSTDGSLEVWHP